MTCVRRQCGVADIQFGTVSPFMGDGVFVPKRLTVFFCEIPNVPWSEVAVR